MSENTITIATIRKMKKQLEGAPSLVKDGKIWGPVQLNPDVHLTVDGMVEWPNGGMHPEMFRDMMGEDAYQELLRRPRVKSPLK